MQFLKHALCAMHAAIAATCVSPGVLTAGEVDDLLIDGKFTFDARLRYEHVQQDNKPNDASAPTLRLRLGFVTGKFEDFQGLIEGEAIGHLAESFDDQVNGKSATYPVVADPEGIELNRLQVEYTGIAQTVVRVGRQRVNLDNQRFVGAVGWRQNEQTFDAALISNTSIDGLVLTYAFVDQVNRIFGKDHPQGEIEGSTHLFNAAYDWASVGKIVGYGYLIDAHEPASLHTSSSASFGLRVSGKQDVGEGFNLGYEAEYAHQSEYADNPNNFSLNYLHGDLSLSKDKFTLLGGVESLDGNGTIGFATPLATLHKFQGYADAFLVTPVNGIVDMYGKFGFETKFDEPIGPITALSVAAWFHDFESEHSSASLGDEFDAELLAKIEDHFALGFKYANYEGVSVPNYPGREKVWLYLDVSY
ncbi:MAG: alginate export family protein [Micropepsaceae bacterium]